jgi:hypothetical protein
MPVEFSFLPFGIGTTKTHIATAAVDVAAKGAPGCPAFALVQWKTPPAPGYYYLTTLSDGKQITAIWARNG